VEKTQPEQVVSSSKAEKTFQARPEPETMPGLETGPPDVQGVDDLAATQPANASSPDGGATDQTAPAGQTSVPATAEKAKARATRDASDARPGKEESHATKPAATQEVPEPAPVSAAGATGTEADVVASEEASSQTATATVEEKPAPRRRVRDKTAMLARALVSDILVYNREARDQALQEGNLLEALGPEIKKSWELYKEKVTPEVANSTTHFRDALNEILAEGQKIF
jgi:hypothetical protein